jgi:rhodanese-related sulfurtransferase
MSTRICGTCTTSFIPHLQQAYTNAPEAMDAVVRAALPSLPSRHQKTMQARRVNAQGMQSFVVKGLKPSVPVFYFAALPSKIGSPLLVKDQAYGDLSNSGVAVTSVSGTLHVLLQCPQVYIYNDGEVYPRHFHFIYGNPSREKWEKEVYTVPILCIVDSSLLDKPLTRSARLVDARPWKDFQQGHIEGALSLPSGNQYTPDEVKRMLSIRNKHNPLIVYCGNPQCGSARSLAEQLNALGFHNLYYLQVRENTL